jgi:hypothetical protein
MSLLTRIMDSIDPPPPIPRPSYTDSWSEETRSKVKQAFSKVKCIANVHTHPRFGRMIAIRPKDINQLEIALAEARLMTDSICQGMVETLKGDSTHYVKWCTSGNE